MDTRAALTGRIAESIQAQRQSSGHTLNEFALATGIPFTTIHRKLGGHKPFTTEELEAIARVLNTTPSALVYDAERVA